MRIASFCAPRIGQQANKSFGSWCSRDGRWVGDPASVVCDRSSGSDGHQCDTLNVGFNAGYATAAIPVRTAARVR